jgi:hypothetical protein
VLTRSQQTRSLFCKIFSKYIDCWILRRYSFMLLQTRFLRRFSRSFISISAKNPGFTYRA